MATEQYSLRLRLDQKAKIRQISLLRQAATKLRSEVGGAGVYGGAQLERFWKILADAERDLMESSTQLAERAGLGAQFFPSVVRDHRSPKLTNFLRALTAIIESANELLLDVEPIPAASSTTRSASEYVQLSSLAGSLARLAQIEIEKLDNERPNDPATIYANEKQRELMVIFANGFQQISVALALHPSEPTFASKARKAVESVGKQVNMWWKNNAADAIDWGVRIPVLAAGIGILGWAGADMTIATSAVAALVGGPKVIEVIKGQAKKSKQGKG